MRPPPDPALVAFVEALARNQARIDAGAAVPQDGDSDGKHTKGGDLQSLLDRTPKRKIN
ncbi:hypothetical protein CHELA40_10265 [Chelatococcus asaccharovorans]|nr:hypothetical protein CHELA40_10265 [Chelatococcus asaccharovorans]CAH1686914.1 hypothetical protein CHELA17_65345 [Chelatococcus asaccharovorans]